MIPITKPTLPKFEGEFERKFREFFSTGMLTNHKYVKEFEAQLSQKLGVKNVIAVSSCTSGLMLTIKSLGLKGEIIVPSFTFSATGHAIHWNGITPKFVDIDPKTYCIDPQKVREAITEKTTGILAVHMFGCPANVKELEEISQEYNLKLIFDAAHGMGSKINKKALGSSGDAEVFSCSPTKLLVTGEGGIVTTNNDELGRKLRIGRNYGDDGSYDCEYPGINARMTEFNALLGLETLNNLEENVIKRNQLVEIYKKELEKTPGITFQEIPMDLRSTFKDFSLYINEEEFGMNRDQLCKELLDLGIQSKKYFYPPLHLQRAYAEFKEEYENKLPVTMNISNNVLSIPLYSHMNNEEVIEVSEKINKIYEKMKMKKILIQNQKTIEKRLFFVHESLPLRETMQKIDTNGKGFVLVVNREKQLKGIITDGDIRRGIINGIDLVSPVSLVMNTNPITIKQGYSSLEIINNIKKSSNLINQLPVINEKGKVMRILFHKDINEILSHNQNNFFQNKSLKEKSKQILIVGGAGYVGSVLTKDLLKKGYRVKVLDDLLFGDESVKEFLYNTNYTLIKGNVCNMEHVIEAIQGVDAIVQLAEIVGDPSCAINPKQAQQINYISTSMIAKICKYFNINRFVYSSSCSVYGASDTELLTEGSELNPVSLYARMKIEVEKSILSMKDGIFSPTILRFATVFGTSPRMRFDLVVNTLTAKAVRDGKITVFGGDQWRPLVHVKDISQAIILTLESPIESIAGEIFNVGGNTQNHTINEIGKMVKEEVPQADLIIEERDIDKRNYKVDFTKIKNELGFDPQYSIRDGIKEVKEALEQGSFRNHEDPKFSNIKTYKLKNFIQN